MSTRIDYTHPDCPITTDGFNGGTLKLGERFEVPIPPDPHTPDGAELIERKRCLDITRRFRNKAAQLNDGPCEDMARQIMAAIEGAK